MPAATTKRRLVFAIAITSYAVVFTSLVLFEVPGLGLGHFFYIPVALLAVSLGARGGFLGGAIAAGLYALAVRPLTDARAPEAVDSAARSGLALLLRTCR